MTYWPGVALGNQGVRTRTQGAVCCEAELGRVRDWRAVEYDVTSLAKTPGSRAGTMIACSICREERKGERKR